MTPMPRKTCRRYDKSLAYIVKNYRRTCAIITGYLY